MFFWVLYTQPLKMELIQGSETSANYRLTPGKYPEENIQDNTLLGPVLNHTNTTATQSIVLFKNVIVAKLANSVFFLYRTRGSVGR